MSQPIGVSAAAGRDTGRSWWARLRGLPAATWARLSFAVMCLAALIGFLAIPTYPIYDTQYYLLWGREIAHGQLPSFTVYEAPTEHPLAVGWGVVMSIFGNAEQRLAVLCAIASFLLLAWGVYRLTRTAFSPIVAATAVALLLTRFNFMFLAARGYVDLTYCAAIVWAAALEIDRPRRGTPVFVVLLAAELIRPDAWLLAGLYWLWCAPRAGWHDRLRWAAIVAAGPLIWVALDWIVTGQPLHSLTSTQNTAVALGRTVPLGQLPGTLAHYLITLTKSAVVAGAIGGVVLSAWLVPRRMLAPFVVLLSGIGTFVVLAGAGLSVIDRYLLMPAVMILVFCAFALSGWTMLERGLLRRVWAAGRGGARRDRHLSRGEHAQRRQDRDRARLPRQRADVAGRDPRRAARSGETWPAGRSRSPTTSWCPTCG